MELSLSQKALVVLAGAILAASLGGWIGGPLLGVFLGGLLGYALFSALLHQEFKDAMRYAPTIERVQRAYEAFEDVL